MSEYTYLHMWEIVDQDLPISVLIAEACRDLDRLVELAGGRIEGAPNWTIVDNRLICKVPARAFDPDEEASLPEVVPGRRTPAAVVAEIQRMAGRGMTPRQISDALGVDRKTVARYSSRAVAA